MLPFSAEQFLEIFRVYNEAVWPAPVVGYALGALALWFFASPGAFADKLASSALAAMWLWTGASYQLVYFAVVNPAAPVFGALFIAQAAVLLHAGWTGRLSFGWIGGAGGHVGVALLVYAALLYPLVGFWSGHKYPAAPSFGITPCPVTIFTLGCLLLSKRPIPLYVVPIPLVWTAIGGSAAVLLGIPQDWVLLASGPAAGLLLLCRRGRYLFAEGGRRA